MPAEFRRRLYARGSSFEATIPMPLLFQLDLKNKKYLVLFTYSAAQDAWHLSFQEAEAGLKGATGPPSSAIGRSAAVPAHPQVQFSRRLYRRGSSYETTIPRPLLFKIDPSMKQEVIFTYDAVADRWFVRIESISGQKEHKPKNPRAIVAGMGESNG